MMVINGATLTTFEVSPDGSTVSINVTDENSKPGSLVLPADCLRALLMSLPKMMQEALQRRYQDASVRLVYPLGHWRLEASTEPGKFILTMSTRDGFAVSFAVSADELDDVAAAAQRARRARVPAPN